MKESVKKDIDKYAKLSSLEDSEGGKVLLESLQKDIASLVETITSQYGKLSHIELISLIANLKSKIDLFRSISRAKKNKTMASEELKRLLKEELNY